MRMKDILETGKPVEIGSYHFTEEAIVAFAREFDPHFFHLDKEAAKGSLFGGLCASGWHVSAAAMKCNVAFLDQLFEQTRAKMKDAPRLGPSPGIRNLKWLKPVFADDTVTYFLTYLGEKPVAHRPGRYISDYRYSGINQNDEPVMQYECSVVEFG